MITNDQPIALLSFGSSAWRTIPCDQLIGWQGSPRVSQLHRVINNTGFLILPWIKLPHLASKLLSIADKRSRLTGLNSIITHRCYWKPLLKSNVLKGTVTKPQTVNVWVPQPVGVKKELIKPPKDPIEITLEQADTLISKVKNNDLDKVEQRVLSQIIPMFL